MLRDKINDNIQKFDSDRFNNSLGVITKYHKSTHTVDVSVEAKGTKNLVLEKIPLPIYGKGINLIPPKVGEKVLIAYTNNSVLQAKVVAIIDNDYEYKSKWDMYTNQSGIFNSNVSFNELEEVIAKNTNNKPLCEYWLDERNSHAFKYNLYTKASPLQDLTFDASKLLSIDEDDLGFIHPHNKSKVNIRKDGTIEIFTFGNDGILIDPNNKSIKINSKKNLTKHEDWQIEAININIACDEFKVKSKKIILDSEELDLQGEQKEIEDIREEI